LAIITDFAVIIMATEPVEVVVELINLAVKLAIAFPRKFK